jgi:DNA-binding XRE family transcriptional regulator
MTQQELAQLLGISKQRVCDIEKNRYHVSLKLCKEIAKKLDLPLEWLAKLTLQDLLESEGIDLKVG